jgi:signal transduction histidine kinase
MRPYQSPTGEGARHGVKGRRPTPLEVLLVVGLVIIVAGSHPDEHTAFEPVDLRGVATDVIRMTEPRWRQDAGVEVVPVLEEVPQILGRKSELREVLTNLVLNALDAMPRGGRLTIATSRSDGRVRLEVADTGTGIPEDLRRRLFVPFTTTKPNGIGLGLSVSYGIVTRHGGTITVESEVGKGSRFVLSLPAAPPAKES